MRTKTENDITVYYADEIGFAFMPCIFKAYGSGITSVTITLRHDDKSYECKADSFGSYCILDYRAYVQAMFDGVTLESIFYYDTYKDKLGEVISCYVSVMAGDTVALKFSFDTFYVWGAMRYGETWGGCQHLTWFTNFPFSFGLYAHDSTKILIGYEGAPLKYVDIEERGIWDFVASRLLSKGARYSIIYSYDGEIKKATFDDMFDLTFYLNSGGAQEKLLRIDYDDTEEGIYLRWIDRHGFYRYWLFTAGDESRAISSDAGYMRNNLMAYQGISGWVGAYGRKGSYAREDTISLCAPSVDSETFDMLQDLTTSPVVDMYLGGDADSGEDKWKSVTINAATYNKTGAPLQDFVCNMVLNDINIQKL